MLNRCSAALAIVAAGVLGTTSALAETAGPPPAQAQAPGPGSAATPAAAAGFGGPSIPGLCLISQQALFTDSKVGAAAAARLQQIQQQIQANLDTGRASLDASAKALAAQRTTLSEIQFAQKERTLNARAQAWQTTAKQRAQQFDATRASVLERITEEAKPAIAAAYQSHNCGVLFDRASVVAGGVGMDITQPVVQALDTKITTLSVDLERPSGPGSER
jgi:Skp family chaperone for outer membrane proteins